MKARPFVLASSLLLSLTGCNSSQFSEIVQESYIHKYGIPVSKDEWLAKGSCGTVVTKRKDGVTVTQNLDRNVLHGKSTYTFPYSETLARTEIYDYGTLAKETDMFPSGAPMEESEYQGASTVTVTSWYEGGTPRSIEVQDQSMLLCGQYFTPENKLESEVVNMAGTRIVRDAYGQLTSQDLIAEGELQQRTLYHSNGTPKEIIPYQDGEISGLKRTFLASGEPETIEHWHQGVQTGVTELYTNGEKVAEVPFIEGKRHGIEKKLRHGREIVEEITWNHDTRHGRTVIHLENGSTAVKWHHNGKPVSKYAFDELNLKARRS